MRERIGKMGSVLAAMRRYQTLDAYIRAEVSTRGSQEPEAANAGPVDAHPHAAGDGWAARTRERVGASRARAHARQDAISGLQGSAVSLRNSGHSLSTSLKNVGEGISNAFSGFRDRNTETEQSDRDGAQNDRVGGSNAPSERTGTNPPIGEKRPNVDDAVVVPAKIAKSGLFLI